MTIFDSFRGVKYATTKITTTSLTLVTSCVDETKLDVVVAEWVHAVRKCVQISLVTLLRPFLFPTCNDIKTNTLDAFSSCFKTAAKADTEICDIGYTNWLNVLVTVHSALTTKRYVSDSLVTAGSCYHNNIDHKVIMVIAWTDKDVANIENLIMDINQVANKLLCNNVFMIALNNDELKRYHGRSEVESRIAVEILMVPLNTNDLNYIGKSNKDRDDLITSFLDLVHNGSITYTEINGLKLIEYKECNDTRCLTPIRAVAAPPPLRADGPNLTPGTYMLLALVYIVVQCLFV